MFVFAIQALVQNVHHFIVIEYKAYLDVRVLVPLLLASVCLSDFNFQLPVIIHMLMVSYYAVYSLIYVKAFFIFIIYTASPCVGCGVLQLCGSTG